MHLKVLDCKDKNRYSSDIKEILRASDKDFVPPLSSRKSTLDKTFSNLSQTADGIEFYFKEMAKQEVLAAIEDGKIIGFVSYILDFSNEYISESDLPNIYVSTLVLSEQARGKGLTKKIYSHLFFDLYPERTVFTRTWSTNLAHTKILFNFGFLELYRKENDRGAGIDTVYYRKEKSRDLITV